MSETASEAIADSVVRHPFFEGLEPTLVPVMMAKAEERLMKLSPVVAERLENTRVQLGDVHGH